MKYVFLFLYFLFSSNFQANPGEDFYDEIRTSLTKITAIKDKVLNFQANTYENYLGPNKIDKIMVQNLFKETHGVMNEAVSEWDWTQINSQQDVTNRTLVPYCRTLHLVKGLHDIRKGALPDSDFQKDIDTLLNAYSIFPNNFGELAPYISTFLNLELASNNKYTTKIKTFKITLNRYEVLFDQKRKARSLLRALKLIKLDKLSLPPAYIAALKIIFKNGEERLEKLAGAKYSVSPELKMQDSMDLSFSEPITVPTMVQENLELLNHMTKVIFTPLNLQNVQYDEGMKVRKT